MSDEYRGYVGMFDSGLGGISVLKECVRELPHESFYFFGDSANAPYGEKTREWVLDRSRQIVEGLLGRGCKAVVIACNTATSAAAAQLRDEYPDVPILGIEPALKPATLAPKHDRVLVMATPMTVHLSKYQHLMSEWGDRSDVVTVPCTGLAARIEQGNLEADDLHELLVSLVGEWRGRIDSCVLGCTHYPFIKPQIRRVLGDVPFFDGGAGTARQLRRRLAAKGLLEAGGGTGDVVLASSIDTPEELALYRRMYAMEI